MAQDCAADRPTFFQLLSDLGAEHDRQLSSLLFLVRDLRVELTKATVGDGLRQEDLRQENLQLKLELSKARLGDATLVNLRNENKELKKKLQLKVAVCGDEEPKKVDVDAFSSKHLEQWAEPPTEMGVAAGQEASNWEAVVPSSAETRLPEESTQEIHEKQYDKAETVKPVAGKLQRFADASSQFVESPACEGVVGFLILANTLVMMFETQYMGLLAGYQTGLTFVEDDPLDTWRGADRVFSFLDRGFTVIFALELLWRGFALRCMLFKQPLNWLDIFAVAVSLLQWAVEEIPVNPTILRLVRAARLIRGIRFLKLAKVLASLSMLIKCIRASVSILFWSLLLLMMIQCMIGMLASQLSQQYILDLSNPEEKRKELYMYFGSFTRAYITMFEIHMANWAPPCRLLVETLGEEVGDFFIFYRCIMGFALMSVIGAVFVQQTMSVVQNDNDIMILKKQKEAESYETNLKLLFAALDKDGDARLSRSEFNTIKADPELNVWMSALDIDPGDLEGLFNMLDSGDDEVSTDEFLNGATRLRGPARSMDMAHVLTKMDRLERQVSEVNRNSRGGHVNIV